MEVGKSQPGPSLKEKLAAITKSFTMKNASNRKRELRVKKRDEAGNPERMKCFVKMNGVRVKSTSQKNGNGNQIHAQRAQSCPPASRGSDSFNRNIEEMVVDDVPIVKTEMLRLPKVIAEAREIVQQVQEGFRFEDEDYLDVVEKGQAEDILLEADDFDAALEKEDLIMGDCETDEDNCCDWLNGEDCNFTTEA